MRTIDSMTRPKTEKTMCIVQISRLGDLIQTLMAAEELKFQNPKVRLILVTRRKFSDPIKFLLSKTFDKIYALDTNEIGIKTDWSLSSVKEKTHDFISEINKEVINVCINLTFSKSSSFLTSLISATHTMGLTRNRMGQLAIHDEWSQYVYSSVMGSVLNPFNLVDIFKKILGVNASSNAYNLHERTLGGKNRIIIHPFASQKKKKWHPKKWSEIIYQILKNVEGSQVVLVGNEQEKHDAVSILNEKILDIYKERIFNYCGEKSLAELSFEFKNSRLFIGHDSLVGNLASYFKVQTITISLGIVRPHETTPYGNGNINLAPKTSCFPCYPEDPCALYPCHTDIPHQLVSILAESMYQGKEINSKFIQDNINQLHTHKVDIYFSEFNKNNELRLHNINHKNDSNNLFRDYYTILWNYCLNEVEESIAFSAIDKPMFTELCSTLDGLQRYFDLNEFGKKFSSYIIEEVKKSIPNLTKIKDWGLKLAEIDELAIILKQNYKFLGPLINFSHIKKGNLPGESLISIAENSLFIYIQTNQQISVLHELIEKTINNSHFKNEPTFKNIVPSEQ